MRTKQRPDADTLRTLENYYLKQPEPLQGCLLALRQLILGVNGAISHQRKYQIPFFYYGDWKLAFMWVHRKKLLLGFVEDRRLHPMVVNGGKRKDNIETFVIDPDSDLPVEAIRERLQYLMTLYDNNQPIL